jgi:hypothetical protein
MIGEGITATSDCIEPVSNMQQVQGETNAMSRSSKATPNYRTLRQFLLGFIFVVVHQAGFAQHGHPLVGSWSGDWKAADGQTGRVLLVINFSEDQVISGNIIEGSVRSPITSATLDPDTWTVTLNAQAKDAGGATVPLVVTGKIENLGSATERAIVGTWKKGDKTSDLQVVIN